MKLWITENEVNHLLECKKITIHNEGSAPCVIDGELTLNPGDKFKETIDGAVMKKRLCIVFVGNGVKKVLITYKQKS